MEIVVIGVATSLVSVAGGCYLIFGDYDLYGLTHTIFNYDEVYTKAIDDLLMKGFRARTNYSRVSRTKRIATDIIIPDKGIHYYYPFLDPNLNESIEIAKKSKDYMHKWMYYVCFRKIEVKLANVLKYYYVSYYLPFQCGVDSFVKFDTFISTDNPIGKIKGVQVMKVISICVTPKGTTFTELDKICENPWNSQKKALTNVIDHFDSPANIKKNTKVMICGESGSGKSYIGLLVKNYLAKLPTPIDSNLYIDFSPSSTISMTDILRDSQSNNKVVILLVNEMDIFYEETSTGTASGTLYHTRNKNTFHNLIDTIDGCKNMIMIMTSEKTPKELYATNRYDSFMRVGRIDFFVEMNMDKENAAKINNNKTIIMN